MECNKNLPPSEAGKKRRCGKIWKQANRWFKEKEQINEIKNVDLIWSNVDQLRIISENKNREIKEDFICYKEENFFENGWCTLDSYSAGVSWGICSESCKHIKNLVNDDKVGHTSSFINK